MELSSFEICKRIAEIEGVNIHHIDGSELMIADNEESLRTGYDEYCEYNPVEDKVLWADLILKYEVSISFVFCKVMINKNGVHERNFTSNLTLIMNSLNVIIDSVDSTQK